MRLFAIFDPWWWLKRRLAKGDSRLIFTRRLECQKVLWPKIADVLRKAITEMGLERDYRVVDDVQHQYYGENYVNWNGIRLVGRMDFSGIVRQRYEQGQPVAWDHVMEMHGQLIFSQTDTNMIGVLVTPTSRIFPQHDIKKDYTVITGSNREHRYSVIGKSEKKPPRYLHLGFFEPWELNESKIRKLTAQGIRIIHETQQNEKEGWYTRWLFLRETDGYKNFMYGVLSSLAVVIIYDLLKGLCQLLWGK